MESYLRMKIHYIYHSGFAIETDRATVIIDYYKDSSETAYAMGTVHDYLLKKPGKLYVLASHFHPDHFNREVLSWQTERTDIIYLFSRDILKHRRAAAEDAHYIKQGEVYEDELLRVQAFGSTDSGVSFLIDIEGKRLFHAGDLNNWHWSDESTPQEVRKAEGDYLHELKLLQSSAPSVDVAMFPVDSRIGTDYMRGAEQFVDHIKSRWFIPMHFSEDYAGGNAFGAYARSRGCNFLSIDKRGECFDLSEI